MRCLLLRHAVTAETGRILSGRRPDIPLSERGVRMAEGVSDVIAGAGVNVVVSSPIQRCRETAAFPAERLGKPVRVMDAFTEVDFGAWSGRRLRDLVNLKAWQRLQDTPSRFRFPDGERLVDAQIRVVDGIEELAAKHPRSTVLVVTHNDAIRLAFAHYLGMPLDLFHRLSAAPVSVSVLELPPQGRPLVLSLNVVSSNWGEG